MEFSGEDDFLFVSVGRMVFGLSRCGDAGFRAGMASFAPIDRLDDGVVCVWLGRVSVTRKGRLAVKHATGVELFERIGDGRQSSWGSPDCFGVYPQSDFPSAGETAGEDGVSSDLGDAGESRGISGWMGVCSLYQQVLGNSLKKALCLEPPRRHIGGEVGIKKPLAHL